MSLPRAIRYTSSAYNHIYKRPESLGWCRCVNIRGSSTITFMYKNRTGAAMPFLSHGHILKLSRPGVCFALAYTLLCVYCILTQGLFGESFVVLVLGLPWTFLLISIGIYNVEFSSSFALYYEYFIALAPLVLNVLILYWVGAMSVKVYRNLHQNRM